MTGDELRAAAIDKLGERAWQKKLAAYLKSDVSSVRRWASGATPVPGPVEVAVAALRKRS